MQKNQISGSQEVMLILFEAPNMPNNAGDETAGSSTPAVHVHSGGTPPKKPWPKWHLGGFRNVSWRRQIRRCGIGVCTIAPSWVQPQKQGPRFRAHKVHTCGRRKVMPGTWLRGVRGQVFADMPSADPDYRNVAYLISGGALRSHRGSLKRTSALRAWGRVTSTSYKEVAQQCRPGTCQVPCSIGIGSLVERSLILHQECCKQSPGSRREASSYSRASRTWVCNSTGCKVSNKQRNLSYRRWAVV